MLEDTMQISRKNISLKSELARGRFAVIFLAKYYTKSECHDVVAKTLKGKLFSNNNFIKYITNRF